MDRQLLQHIWDRQLFSASILRTTANEPLRIMDTGRRNPGAGPDFLDARVCIGDRLRKGHVQLQVLSSERSLQGDPYAAPLDDLALQVVWRDDAGLAGHTPVLELHKKVPSAIPLAYSGWTTRKRLLPCTDELGSVPPGMIYPYLRFMAGERFTRRARQVMDAVKALGMDWPEALWRAMARGFGHRVNADAFERLAISLPYSILLRHRARTEQLEALLLGQAGLLRPDSGDVYARELFTAYGSLRKKYKLTKSHAPVHFQRMRPSNFPTIRLAQLAMLLHNVPELFRLVKEIRDPDIIRDMLNVEASAYWDTHYRFGETSVNRVKQTGTHLVRHLLVNTILPFTIAYNLHIGNAGLVQAPLEWLSRLAVENHSVIHAFAGAGLPARNLSDAQGLLELHATHCSSLGCAGCAIGKMMLRQFTVQGCRSYRAS